MAFEAEGIVRAKAPRRAVRQAGPEHAGPHGWWEEVCILQQVQRETMGGSPAQAGLVV